jgi:uncharacterized protein with beta-barrel porin domain
MSMAARRGTRWASVPAPQVFGDRGYCIDAGGASDEPCANLAYSRTHTGSVTENGMAGLTSQGEDMCAAFTTIGVRPTASPWMAHNAATSSACIA